MELYYNIWHNTTLDGTFNNFPSYVFTLDTQIIRIQTYTTHRITYDTISLSKRDASDCENSANKTAHTELYETSLSQYVTVNKGWAHKEARKILLDLSCLRTDEPKIFEKLMH